MLARSGQEAVAGVSNVGGVTAFLQTSVLVHQTVPQSLRLSRSQGETRGQFGWFVVDGQADGHGRVNRPNMARYQSFEESAILDEVFYAEYSCVEFDRFIWWVWGFWWAGLQKFIDCVLGSFIENKLGVAAINKTSS